MTCTVYFSAQGSCREFQIPISVLNRKEGRCMRVTLSDGQTLLFEDWRLGQKMVKTGCQCMLDVRSALAAGIRESL